jgi:DMSO/TMAO reductase YedYZ molybdopterin-dependent catalytic subunit
MMFQTRNMRVLALALFILLLLFGCTQGKPIKLQGTEVQNYKGEKLGSANDFQENSINGPQHIDVRNYTLEISGLVDSPKSLTYEQVLSHQRYSKAVTLYCVEGWDVKVLWDGVLVKDLLNDAKVRPEAKTAIFYAYDGYTTSFPISYLSDNDILMAYQMNNVTLPPERGFPFQLVAEDKWGYKWIKWITKIELSADESYKGYWESRGYSNNGDLNKPKFE